MLPESFSTPPDPPTRARHRTYTVVATVALIALVAIVLWRLNASGQFEGESGSPSSPLTTSGRC